MNLRLGEWLRKSGWQIPHFLSFDVVIGTVLSYAAASRLPDGTHPVNGLTALVLGLTVWVIYTLDRLLDIRKPTAPATARHHFHREHQQWLWWAVVGLALVAAVLSFWLPKSVWRFGIGLGILTAGYLAIVSRLSGRNTGQIFKEPFTALIYTAGIWGAALASPVVTWPDVVLALLYGVLVFQSLLLYSWYEAFQVDNDAITLVTWLHPETAVALAEGLAGGIALVVAFVSLIGVEHYQQRFLFVLLAMTVLHGMLTRYRVFFQQNDRYRMVGEMIFWLPGLLL